MTESRDCLEVADALGLAAYTKEVDKLLLFDDLRWNHGALTNEVRRLRAELANAKRLASKSAQLDEQTRRVDACAHALMAGGFANVRFAYQTAFEAEDVREATILKLKARRTE